MFLFVSDILPNEKLSEIIKTNTTEKDSDFWEMLWVMRYSVLIKCRGIIKTKAYITKCGRDTRRRKWAQDLSILAVRGLILVEMTMVSAFCVFLQSVINQGLATFPIMKITLLKQIFLLLIRFCDWYIEYFNLTDIAVSITIRGWDLQHIFCKSAFLYIIKDYFYCK